MYEDFKLIVTSPICIQCYICWFNSTRWHEKCSHRIIWTNIVLDMVFGFRRVVTMYISIKWNKIGKRHY